MANFAPLKQYMLRHLGSLIARYGVVGPFADLGTGSGDVARWLAERGWRGIAVEGSPRAAAVASTTLRPCPSVELIIGPIETLAAARKYPAQEIIHAVSMIAGVSRELVARVLRDPGVEPFAVMCKSLGLARSDFFAIVSRKDAENPLDPARAEAVLGVFDSMARDYARAVLRYWDWDGNPRIAHITRLLGLDGEAA
jgi:hypothetical protein